MKGAILLLVAFAVQNVFCSVTEGNHATWSELVESFEYVAVLFYKELGRTPHDLQLFGTFHLTEALYSNDRHLKDRDITFIQMNALENAN